MSAQRQSVCPNCGEPLSGTLGFCPVCLIRGMLAGEQADSGEPSSEDALKAPSDRRAPRFGHYELLMDQAGQPLELGRGAMGITYKALDVDLHCPVTLKVISERYLGDKSAQLRFLREARAAAKVRHTNVASVFHLGRTASSYFYAMEFVEGETLESLIKRSGRLEVKLALEIMTQVAAGLAAVHEQNLVHRDIKPSNILVHLKDDGSSTAKIIDLGLAKAVNEPDSQTAISTPGGFAGTPEFASPEQFAGVDVDIRSDLYSLGVVLWEMVTGHAVFRGSPAEVMYQHQHTPLPFEELKGIPPPIIALLEVLLEKDPGLRFQNPAELLKAIPKITGALDAGRRITRQSLQKATSTASRVRTRKPPTKPGPEKISVARLPVTGSDIFPGKAPKPAANATAHKKDRWLAAIGLVGAAAIIGAGAWFLAANKTNKSNLSPRTTIPAKSIAVLPFESLSADKQDSYFADGVQDEILNDLAKIAQLTVISRTSVMQYRAGEKRDLRQVANDLGVANVLEGTVRRSANRVRVSTELIDARQDKTIWADSFDRDLTDIFAIQSEVAETIARKLTATLSPDEKNRIEAKPTENLAAYDLYLRAKRLTLRFGFLASLEPMEEPLGEAISLLDQAVRLDPKFTLAYCELARANGLLYVDFPTSERRQLGDAAINNALRLQPDLPEVHLAYAYHLSYGYDYGEYQRAREQLEVAKRGLANNTDLLRLEAYMDRRQGNWEKAIREYNEAIALDPLNTFSIRELADTYIFSGEFSAAEKTFDRLIELLPDQPLLKVEKATIPWMMRANDGPARSAIAALPASIVEDRSVLTMRLLFALNDRDWSQAKEIIEKFNGREDAGAFAYGRRPVPAGCYSILIARLEGEHPGATAGFAEVREQLNQKVQKSPEGASFLSQLSVVDALLGNKEVAVSEAKRAVEMLPISKDAIEGPFIAENLAVVYAWTDEPDLAFKTLVPLAKRSTAAVSYGLLKLDPYWDPLRNDPRFNKLLAELAPRD